MKEETNSERGTHHKASLKWSTRGKEGKHASRRVEDLLRRPLKLGTRRGILRGKNSRDWRTLGKSRKERSLVR